MCFTFGYSIAETAYNMTFFSTFRQKKQVVLTFTDTCIDTQSNFTTLFKREDCSMVTLYKIHGTFLSLHISIYITLLEVK